MQDKNIIWRLYRSASKLGDDRAAVAADLGISMDFLETVLSDEPAALTALTEGASVHLPYLVSVLTPDLRQYWKDLTDVDNAEPHQRALLAVANGGEAMKKRMFALALVETNFQVSRVTKVLGISKKTYDKWINEDPEFVELLQEIQFHKKNFAESALFSLVAAGSEKSVLFVNQTLNKETYGNEVKVTGEITQAPGVLDLAALGLPFELEKQILQFIQTRAVTDSDGTLISPGS